MPHVGCGRCLLADLLHVWCLVRSVVLRPSWPMSGAVWVLNRTWATSACGAEADDQEHRGRAGEEARAVAVLVFTSGPPSRINATSGNQTLDVAWSVPDDTGHGFGYAAKVA